jgi:hypothetical protein
MSRSFTYQPPNALPDLYDEDEELAPWQVDQPAREAACADPTPADQARLVSALDSEVKLVSSLVPYGRRQPLRSETSGDTAEPCRTGGDNDSSPQTSGDNSLRPGPSLVSPETEARLAEQARLVAHYDRVRSGQFKLDLDFVLLHLNRKGFHPGKPRRGRDGTQYPSAAPSDWARFFARLKLNGEHWKVNLAPPEIWALQYDAPVGKRRSRIAGPVAHYREIIEAYLGQTDPDVPPHEGRVWLGLLWRDKPGDPGFSRGPRYHDSDMTWVVVHTNDDLKPVTLEVGCALPSWHDDATGDPGVVEMVSLVERETKRQIRQDKAGQTADRDRLLKWVYFRPGYVMTAADKALVSPKGQEIIGNGQGS